MSSLGGGVSALHVHALRLGPGSELLGSLRAFVEARGLRAPFVLTCVGSLISARLRLAGATAISCSEALDLSGPHEILSLVGTLNPEPHLHICLADAQGNTVGGHVLGNLQVFTTAEVVLGEASDLAFSREMDHRTGFPKLLVQPRT